MHTTKPSESERRSFKIEIGIRKLKRYRPQGTVQISAELIKAGANITRYDIDELINFIWNKEKLPQQWKESITVRICKKGDIRRRRLLA
jgi:hypothetical protein